MAPKYTCKMNQISSGTPYRDVNVKHRVHSDSRVVKDRVLSAIE